jgi:hypothetical protein
MPVPIRSLESATADATEALQLSLYLSELDRQAKIATRAFGRAWVGAIARQPDEDQVWADLQATLFATIIVERIIRPSLDAVRARDGHTRAECRDQARSRAQALRSLLDLADDSTTEGASLFSVSAVRHPLEHIDERFDGLVLNKVTSISDFYISHGQLFQSTYSDQQRGGGANFRTFVAPAGLLIFDGGHLDMFKIDHELMVLRADAIPAAQESLAGRLRGRHVFGGQCVGELPRDSWRRRVEAFLEMRRTKGEPIAAEIQFLDHPDNVSTDPERGSLPKEIVDMF